MNVYHQEGETSVNAEDGDCDYFVTLVVQLVAVEWKRHSGDWREMLESREYERVQVHDK